MTILSPSALSQISALSRLSLAGLRAQWKALCETEPPEISRTYLERRLAQRIQEIELGGPSAALQREINALTQTGLLATGKQVMRPPCGTVLIREYADVEHRVTVTRDGQYEYLGKRYKSLSLVARTITGTQWSGPLFFGLKRLANKTGKKGAHA